MPLQSILPPDILACYRPATDNEIRAESFGLLKAARLNSESEWRNQRGIFDDQAIFGPKHAFRCACGKFAGHQNRGIICDQCGVKLQSAEVRWMRCAHINLPAAIAHPLSVAGETLGVVPVLPVAFVEAPSGAHLLGAYGEVLRGADAKALALAFSGLLTVLAPLLATAHEWSLPERPLIAHGMALKDKAH